MLDQPQQQSYRSAPAPQQAYAPRPQQQRGPPQPSSNVKDLEKEMKDMERSFEDDFKFAQARARAASQRSHPSDDAAFQPAAQPASKGALPAIDPAAFGGRSAPSGGFSDSFDSPSKATSSPSQPAVRAGVRMGPAVCL